MRVQAATTLPIPLELLRKWAYDDVDVEHALEVNDENFEPRPEPRYPYDGRREDLVPIIDLRTVLDTADTSGELAALLDVLASDGTIRYRAFKPNGASNPLNAAGVEQNPYFLTGTLTAQQRTIPVVQRVVEYLQHITGLVVANVVLNVYSGDHRAGPTHLQFKHDDYSAKTPRVVIPIAVVGSSRFFRVTAAGDLLFEYKVTADERVGLYMNGPTRGAGTGHKHGGCEENIGPSCSLHCTFTPSTDSDEAVLARLKASNTVVVGAIQQVQNRLDTNFERTLAGIVEAGPKYQRHNFSLERAKRAVPPPSCHPPVSHPRVPCRYPILGSTGGGGAREGGAPIHRWACRPSSRRRRPRTARSPSRGRRRN